MALLKSTVIVALLATSCGITETKKLKKSNDMIGIRLTEKFDRPTDCRAHIKEALCLVAPDPNHPNEVPDNSKKRSCLGGEGAYVEAFEQLYDNYPPVLQKMFCSLRKIQIEEKFFGTAYANIVWKDEANHVSDGAIMGIRKSVLDEKLTLTRWSSWKEQLSFGGVVDSYTVKDDLPKIETSSKDQINDFLYFVVAHEFGHFLDFSNNLNEQINCSKKTENPDDQVCDFADGSWGSLSWENTKTILPEFDFELRPELCFYWCDGKTLGKDQIDSVYQGLSNAPFVSTYSTTNARDDFAETFAYRLLNQYVDSKYSLVTPAPAQIRYDIIEKLRGERMASKVEYVDDVIAKDDLKYP
ncbi:MAG: hypothetical protein AB7T49_12645 [Oligoflexales bacterium]